MEIKTENSIKQRDLSNLSAVELQAIISEQDIKIEKFSRKIDWLENQFKLFLHKKFSRSSETQNALQMSLFDEGDAKDANDDAADVTSEQDKEEITYTRSKPNRKSKNIDTSTLPREQHIIDLSEEEKQCPCGCRLEEIGKETKEEIKYKRAELKVIEHVRIKYACRTCETVKQPAAVELPILKSKASAELLTEVIINKYSYHLPLYRQSKMFADKGIKIPDNTLGGWIMKSAEQLAPLGDALWKQLPFVKALQADETPVKLLEPEKKAYMWLYHSYRAEQRFIIFDFNISRSSEVVNGRLKDFKGILQTDGYSGYNTQRNREDIISIGCWDHARRKFADVVKAGGKNKIGKAGMMLKKIATLYKIEQDIKDLSFEERKTVRQEKAWPEIQLIYKFLHEINAPPKSLLSTAVIYCKNQWDDLVRYINYGEAEISNCWIENQVRPFAIGKKNWMFVGNEISAQRGAMLYSLIQSCGLNKIDPRAYFEYVLKQVHCMRRNEIDPAILLPHTIDKSLLIN